ncbi:hypothetical protein ARSEF4850_003476 [Beauveria asiatica]
MSKWSDFKAQLDTLSPLHSTLTALAAFDPAISVAFFASQQALPARAFAHHPEAFHPQQDHEIASPCHLGQPPFRAPIAPPQRCREFSARCSGPAAGCSLSVGPVLLPRPGYRHFAAPGGYWRNHDALQLDTPQAFKADPGMVWLLYGYRRHTALRAKPNPAHQAMAALARENKDFLCLTQNVDSKWLSDVSPAEGF